MQCTSLVETKDRYKLLSSPRLQTLAKTESSLMSGARKYCEEQGFTEIMIPHLTKATGSCENFMTVFGLDYFGERAYLTQTGQLYLEVITPYLKKVWCVIHSFRKEPDADSRHLTEFPLVELEFEGGFDLLTHHIEGVISSMVKKASEEREEELKLFEVDKDYVKKFEPPYKRIDYTQAVDMLQKNDVKIDWGDDIKSSHEKLISNYLGIKPFFLTHWPTPIKFFDMKTNEIDPRVVNSCDLILPYSGEAVGGAEREHTYETLRKKLEESVMLKLLKEIGGDVNDFNWFLDCYKNREVGLHSGFGVGFNRVTQSLLKLSDIRESTVFPLNRESIF
jgi:asparaginyl-tRNA synthetase